MEFLMLLGVIAVCVLVIWLNWIIANEFFNVAKSKGYSENKYLWYCFLFGFIGYLLVIALKDNKPTSENKFELPEL